MEFYNATAGPTRLRQAAVAIDVRETDAERTSSVVIRNEDVHGGIVNLRIRHLPHLPAQIRPLNINHRAGWDIELRTVGIDYYLIIEVTCEQSGKSPDQGKVASGSRH